MDLNFDFEAELLQLGVFSRWNRRLPKMAIPKRKFDRLPSIHFQGRTGSFLGGYIFFQFFLFPTLFFGLLYWARISILQRRICGHFNFQVTVIEITWHIWVPNQPYIYIYVYIYIYIYIHIKISIPIFPNLQGKKTLPPRYCFIQEGIDAKDLSRAESLRVRHLLGSVGGTW